MTKLPPPSGTQPDDPHPDARASRASATRDAATYVEGERGAPTGGGDNAGLYGLLVESVRDYAIFALDPRGYVLTWNEGARRIKGYTRDEIVGQHFSKFYPPEDIAAGKTEMELEVAARVGTFEDEGWRLRKDGTRFWANVVITALRDATGALVGFAKVTRDLTERRAAEEALRQSEERFRLLVASVRDYAIFLLDTDGRIATWNEGARRIKGYEPEEIIGQHFSKFYPPEDVWWTEVELEIARREGRVEDEGWRVRKDGTRFWANVVITALRNRDGELIGFAKVTRDLTDRKAAEERAVEAARRAASAEAANRAKAEFLATMSHELRTPLNAIGGYADLLEVGVAGELSDKQHEFVQRILTSQKNLLRLINDLLNYSRIEAGGLTFQRVPVPIAATAARALLLVTPQAAAKHITLTQPTGEQEPTVASSDDARVEQIVLNLLSNAVKFTPNDGRITVTTGIEDDCAVIRVADTGPGVPENKREEIFEPFVQLNRTLSQPAEGAGLGLAISRDLARRLGGNLSVDDNASGGSVFVLTLPLAMRR